VIAHGIGMVATIAIAIFCTLLPFLPGGYDPLAVPLSAMAQTFGKVSLLLVPVGIVWLVSRHSNRLARKQRTFAIVALAVGSVVSLIVALAALVHSGFVLGSAVVGVWAGAIWVLSHRLTTVASATAAPHYLIVVPLAVAIIQFAVDDPITEFSRGRAIRNSTGLIADLERYRDTYGQYPISMVALWNDYRPAVMGIKEFRYERYGDAYNVLFEPFTFRIGTREIVMYNPRDEHGVMSHDSDLLHHGPEQWQVRGGYYAVHDAPHPHWKYFWFD
jgi:hypothetical protein